MRLDNPAWGQAKIIAKFRRKGLAVSENKAGRILCHLAMMRSLAFMLVLGVILFVVFAMYEIQGQIAAGF